MMRKNFRNIVLKFGIVFAFVLCFQAASVAYAVDLTGTMANSRTLKAGDNECYRTISNINAGASIKALGRNESGSWVFIWADAGDGWVPAGTVNLTGGVMALSVWGSPFSGEARCAAPAPAAPVAAAPAAPAAPAGPTAEQVAFETRVCGADGGTTRAQTTRWTDIFRTADPDSTHTGYYLPNTSVTILGRDFWGCWVKVSGAGTTGWVPINSLSERGVMSLPMLIDNSEGCSIGDGTVVCPDA